MGNSEKQNPLEDLFGACEWGKEEEEGWRSFNDPLLTDQCLMV